MRDLYQVRVVNDSFSETIIGNAHLGRIAYWLLMRKIERAIRNQKGTIKINNLIIRADGLRGFKLISRKAGF